MYVQRTEEGRKEGRKEGRRKEGQRCNSGRNTVEVTLIWNTD